MKEPRILQIAPVPFVVNYVGYDFEKKEAYRWPILGVALVEGYMDEETYTYMEFFSSDCEGGIDLEKECVPDDRLGYEFYGKEQDWTPQIKRLIERKEKKTKKTVT